MSCTGRTGSGRSAQQVGQLRVGDVKEGLAAAGVESGPAIATYAADGSGVLSVSWVKAVVSTGTSEPRP